MMPFNVYPNLYQTPMYNPQPTPMGIQGKVVGNFQEITIGDIPTDGTPAFFIKSDLSEIQTRKWADDGRVISSVFRPFTPVMENLPTETKESETEATPLITEAIMKRLDEIDARIEKLIPKTRAKKEEDKDI